MQKLPAPEVTLAGIYPVSLRLARVLMCCYRVGDHGFKVAGRFLHSRRQWRGPTCRHPLLLCLLALAINQEMSFIARVATSSQRMKEPLDGQISVAQN